MDCIALHMLNRFNLLTRISTYFNVFLGGRIDHGHHAGWAVTALHEAVAMDKAVAKTKQIVDRGKQTT